MRQQVAPAGRRVRLEQFYFDFTGAHNMAWAL
jgi:hypothetical protein